MKTFTYTAVDTDHRPATGTIEAHDWNAAQALLAARGLSECSAVALSETAGTLPVLSKSDAMELASYVSELSKAGLPLGGALRAVSTDLGSGSLATALAALAARLEAGQSIEVALDSLQARLSPHVRGMIVAGSRSGRLAEALDRTLAHERRVDDLTRRFWQAVAYPATLLAFLIVWLLFASWWLIPAMQLRSLLSDLGSETISNVSSTMWVRNSASDVEIPPAAARMDEFAYITPRILLTVACAALVIIGGALALGGRALVSRLFTELPLLGAAWWYRGLSECCGLLSVFLSEQLPLDEALRLTALAARDPAIGAACLRAADGVEAGRPLAQCLQAQSLFPPTLINLADWGQEHAALAESFDSARRMFEDRFELQMESIRLILPPIAFLLAGGSALFFASSILGTLPSILRVLSF